MNALSHRVWIYSFSVLMLLAAGAAAYLQEPLVLGIPFGVLMGLVLVQHPVLLFYVLVASIPWSVEVKFSSGLSTDLPDEPLMLLTAFCFLAWLIAQRKKIPQQPYHPMLLVIALQFVWTVITVAVSTDFILSLKFLLAKSWYLAAFVVAPFILFRNEKVIRNTGLVLMGSMLLFMFTALVRHAQNGWTFEKINDSLLPFFRNHVNYSALLVFTVPLQIAVIRLTGSRQWRSFLTCTLIITIGALYFSYARGAWLALLTGWISYWLIRKKWLFPAYLVFLVFVVGAVFWLKSNDRYLKFSHDYKTTIFHTDFREHLVATYQLKDVSTAERFYRWIAGVRMVKDKWISGYGPSTFYDHYKSYGVPAFKTWVSKNEERSTVHNYFLLVLIEQGLPGLLFFLLLTGLAFYVAQKVYHRTQDFFWKRVVAAAAAILVMECTVNFLSDMIETDKVGPVFYLCISVLMIADLFTRKSDPAADVQRIA